MSGNKKQTMLYINLKGKSADLKINLKKHLLLLFFGKILNENCLNSA